MGQTDDCLGVCVEGRQLYYAVSHPDRPAHLSHIGSIDFGTSLDGAFLETEGRAFEILQRSLDKLIDTYQPGSLRFLVPARHECWSTFPRLVHETADEREDHLNLLMSGTARSDLETTWNSLSNREFRMMMIRDRRISDRLRDLTRRVPGTEFVSEFELASHWHEHSGNRGEFLILCAREGTLSITSSLLGTLRGATWLPLERISDLPFLWQWYGKELSWMNGFHDQIYLCGSQAMEIRDRLAAILDSDTHLHIFNTLEEMQVQAEESTYGFQLERAFPAILLSLQRSTAEARS